MPSETPSERALVARIAAHEKWAKTADRSAATAPARRVFTERFEREVDPGGVLPPEERARRAANARQAWYARLALKSAQARRSRVKADRLAADVEAAIAAGGPE
jgi:hypothetical protein